MLRIYLLAFFLFFYTENIFACCTMTYTFNVPSYIDMEFKQWDRYSYDPSPIPKMHLILTSLPNSDLVDDERDKEARELSQEQEPQLYAIYQTGAEKYNNGSYDEALKIFTNLRNQIIFDRSMPKYSWVREASTYMIARTERAIAQKNWDGYKQDIALVQKDRALKAEESYKAYLKEYPNGLYADSAKNIQRNLYLLTGNQAELDAALKKAVLLAFPNSSISSAKPKTDENILIEFVNNHKEKIDLEKDSPILVAYELLEHHKATSEDLKILKLREKDFANYPNLFNFLYGLTLLHLGQYQNILNSIPETPLAKTPLSLGVALLRSRAMYRLGKYQAALAVLEKMYAVSPEDALILEIATLKLNQGQGLWLYSDMSPIKDEPKLRLFANVALTDKELEDGIHQKNITDKKHIILVEELERRYLLKQEFKKLITLFDKEPQAKTFSLIRSTIENLVKNKDNMHALSDLGEYLYQNYITPNSDITRQSYPWVNATDDLEVFNSWRQRIVNTTPYVPPSDYFRKVLSLAKSTGQWNESEAKALHYLVMGTHGQECVIRCHWTLNIAHKNSKAYFDRLHRVYMNSIWAKNTPYWYVSYS